jgi:hypothetical protein
LDSFIIDFSKLNGEGDYFLLPPFFLDQQGILLFRLWYKSIYIHILI